MITPISYEIPSCMHPSNDSNNKQLEKQTCLCDKLFTNFNILKLVKLLHAVDFLAGRLEASHSINAIANELERDLQGLVIDEIRALRVVARKYVEDDATLLKVIIEGYDCFED